MFAFFVALSSQAQSSDEHQAETGDRERVLDPVTTTTPNPGPEDPKTGEFIFHPVMYLSRRGGGTPLQQIDFYFSPIEESPDGIATLYELQNRARYRVSVPIPKLDPTGTRFQLQMRTFGLGPQSLTLPGGTYALSEILYTYNAGVIVTRRNNINPMKDTSSFCLSEETYVFDVQNGKTQFLGALALAPFPTNFSHLRRHYPIIGVDQRPETVFGSDQVETRISAEPLNFDLLPFDPEQGLCSSGGRVYNVAALAP